MMKKTIIIAAAAGALATGVVFGAQQNWNVALTQSLYSDGSTFTTDFTFQLGGFATGFSPTGSNFSDWQSNFLTGNLVNSANSWVGSGLEAFPTFGSGSGETVVRPSGAADSVAAGQQAYIWGYNSLDISGSSEWILLTNASWTFPTGTAEGGTALPTGTTWSTSDNGTMMVFGTAFNHADGVGATEMLLQTQAIPEPSTYALIFGLGILGFLGYRRVRK